MTRVRDLAAELKVCLVTGFAERRDDQVPNSAVMFAPDGRVVLHYSKGALICFDRQVPETARLLALRGADVLFVPSWGGYGEMNHLMMRARAYENSVYLAFVRPKRALLVDPSGTVLAADAGVHDQIIMATITTRSRRKALLLQYRRPELYNSLSDPR